MSGRGVALAPTSTPTAIKRVVRRLVRTLKALPVASRVGPQQSEEKDCLKVALAIPSSIDTPGSFGAWALRAAPASMRTEQLARTFTRFMKSQVPNRAV